MCGSKETQSQDVAHSASFQLWAFLCTFGKHTKWIDLLQYGLVEEPSA